MSFELEKTVQELKNQFLKKLSIFAIIGLISLSSLTSRIDVDFIILKFLSIILSSSSLEL
jgi:hypothetical protein